MITSLALTLVLAQPGSTFKVPVYNADQKNPAVTSYVNTTLPAGLQMKVNSVLERSSPMTESSPLLSSSRQRRCLHCFAIRSLAISKTLRLFE